MMKRANRLVATIRKATLGLAWGTAFLLTAILAASAQAQTDLDGSDLIVTYDGPWNYSYHNSNNNSQSIVAIYNLANGTRYDYTGSFTGNLFIDITHQGYANDDNRFTFSNAGNSIAGGATGFCLSRTPTNSSAIPAALRSTMPFSWRMANATLT